MTVLGTLLVILLVMFIVAIPAVFLMIKYWKIPATTETLVISEDTSKTSGSAIGLLIKKEVGKGGRVIITMLPKDTLDPKPVRFVVESEKILTLPKGVWMKDKDAIRVLPNSAQEWMANMFSNVEDRNALTSIINAQKEGLDRSQAHLMDMGEGELSRQNMALSGEMFNQITRTPAREDKSGRPGSYPSAAPREQFS